MASQANARFAEEGVTVLIVGGLSHIARPLLGWLLATDADAQRAACAEMLKHGHNAQPASDSNTPKVRYVRVADKAVVAKDANGNWVMAGGYIDPPCHAALEDPRVEYMQANLNLPASVAKVFAPPDALRQQGVEGFDFVWDLTGDGIEGVASAPAAALLERTTRVARTLALEASRWRSVRAYVRVTMPVWKTKPSEGRMREGGAELASRSHPKSAKGFCWHEAERQVAGVRTLPCAVLRIANVWDGFQGIGSVMPRLGLSEIYRFTKEPFKMLWSADLALNTLHTSDLARAMWCTSLWLSSRTRQQADAEAGEDIVANVPKDKGKAWGVDLPAFFSGASAGKDEAKASASSLVPLGDVVRCPVFNVVDDGETNQGKIMDICSEIFGISTGFVNAAVNAYAKLNLQSVIDDMNEKHGEEVLKLMPHVKRPINPSTPFVMFIGLDDAAQRAVDLDGTKLRRIVGWRSEETFNAQRVRAMVEAYREMGIWADTE